MKVGIDTVEVSRFEKMSHLDAFIKKYFSDYEIVYIESKKQKLETVAGIYAAKEALLKALQIGVISVAMLKETEIWHTDSGAPYYKLSQKLCDTLLQGKYPKTSLSITHTKELATAICIIE